MSHFISTAEVLPTWIDYNQHMNAGYYAVAFDNALDDLLHAVDVKAHMAATGGTFYTVETHIIYKQELKLGAPLRFETQIIGLDRKKLQTFTTLYHAQDDFVAGSAEMMLLHFNQRTDQVEAMPDGFYAKLSAIAEQHANLPTPKDAGRAVRQLRVP